MRGIKFFFCEAFYDLVFLLHHKKMLDNEILVCASFFSITLCFVTLPIRLWCRQTVQQYLYDSDKPSELQCTQRERKMEMNE